MTSVGVPEKLRGDCLPTVQEIYNHFLYLIIERSSTGEWKHNTPFDVKVTAVCSDVKTIWDKTPIPNVMHSREGERRIRNILNKCKELTKIPVDRRQAGFGEHLSKLFDASLCQHQEEDMCTCDINAKVSFKCHVSHLPICLFTYGDLSST